MSWQSPIEIMVADAEYRLEESVMKAIQKYGIKVDKDELLKALKYDREQYDKGFRDGCRATWDLIVRCRNCVHNGLCAVAKAGDFCDSDFCSRGERREDE